MVLRTKWVVTITNHVLSAKGGAKRALAGIFAGSRCQYRFQYKAHGKVKLSPKR